MVNNLDMVEIDHMKTSSMCLGNLGMSIYTYLKGAGSSTGSEATLQHTDSQARRGCDMQAGSKICPLTPHFFTWDYF